MSKLLREAVAQSQEGNASLRKKLRTIANQFINASEISAQEASWSLLHQHMSEASEGEIFISTSPPEERVRIVKSEEALRQLDPDSTEIFVTGLIDHYQQRPDSLENMCLAHFAAWYNFSKKRKSATESQTECTEAAPAFGEDNNEEESGILALKDKSGFLRKRRKAKVIRYRRYKLSDDPDNFYRELLMLYLPWRNEEAELLTVNCKEKFDSHKMAVSEARKEFVFSDDDVEIEQAIRLVEELIQDDTIDEEEVHQEDEFAAYDFDPREFQADILIELGEVPAQNRAEEFRMPKQIDHQEYVNLLRCLNARQRDYLMHAMHNLKTGKSEIRNFISGSAGTGKTMLIKALYQSLLLFYNKERGSDPFEMKVLLCAPTGKAAHNIDGMTLHSAFALPVNQAGSKMIDLSADVSNTLAVTFIKTKALIIDEISMVGAQMLNNLNRRLQDIFRNKNDFGGIAVFVFGDFRQLPPVGDRFVFQPSSSDVLGQLIGPPSVLWEKFDIFELTEIMRQRQDVLFANALCHLADGKMSESDVSLLASRCYREQDLPDEAKKAVRLFNTNVEVDHFNNIALQSINTEFVVADAFDSTLGPGTAAAKNAIMQAALAKKVSETYGLPQSVLFKISARYMMTNNVDTSDGLVNGSAGRLRKIQYGTHKTSGARAPLRVWVEFDSDRVGEKARTKMRECMERNDIPPSWTPIDTITRVIHTRKSSSLQVVRRQFPLVPAEGMTIHKSQGGTYSNIVVQLKDGMRRTALYVACSRSTSASGLFLIGNFRAPQPPSKTDCTAVEMKRLREKPLTPMFQHLREPCEETRLMFHNVQSLHKHILDVKCDPCFMSSDILLFAETWTLPQDNVTLESFQQVARMDCQEKRKAFGVAAFIKTSLMSAVSNLKTVCKTQQNSAGHVEAMRFEIKDTSVTVVYKSPATNLETLLDALTEIETESTCRQYIVAGDFNVDLNTQPGQQLIQKFASFGLKNICPPNTITTDGDTQIDAIFANVPATGGVYESLLSYHKPLWCTFRMSQH